MALYMSCGLCGRKQAEGILSRAAWGHYDAGQHGTLQACPTCKEMHRDWQDRLLVAVNGGTEVASRTQLA